MFLAVDHSKQSLPQVPRGSEFRPADWRVLAGFWHPVVFTHEVSDQPLAARLLDVDLVLWRAGGRINVARDVCMHRGTKLSGGRVENGRLVCPMHGLQYDTDGRCLHIPSIAEPDARIPDALRLGTCRAEQRHGIVWVCLAGEPIWPLPRWEFLDRPDAKPICIPPATWHAAASRHVENFNDIAHFPWVHGGTFGGGRDAAFAPYEVRETDYGLAFELPYTELGNRFPDGRADLENRDVIYRYQLTFPFSTLIEVDVQGSPFVHWVADAVCPVSVRESRILQIMSDNSPNPDAAYWTRDAQAINEQDRPLVESQHPEELPLDLRAEVHIPADRLSLAYRRALAARFGLGAPITS